MLPFCHLESIARAVFLHFFYAFESTRSFLRRRKARVLASRFKAHSQKIVTRIRTLTTNCADFHFSASFATASRLLRNLKGCDSARVLTQKSATLGFFIIGKSAVNLGSCLLSVNTAAFGVHMLGALGYSPETAKNSKRQDQRSEGDAESDDLQSSGPLGDIQFHLQHIEEIFIFSCNDSSLSFYFFSLCRWQKKYK